MDQGSKGRKFRLESHLERLVNQHPDSAEALLEKLLAEKDKSPRDLLTRLARIFEYMC